MKLATFTAPGNASSLGCVDAEAATVRDLKACHRALFGSESMLLHDMQSLIDGGEAALDLIRRIVERSAGDPGHTHTIDGVRLLAPVPVPMQIRDFSAYERHLVEAPLGMARLRARLEGQPAPAMTEASRTLSEVYRRQPIYYLSNRFNVVGHNADVAWPSYCEYLDYELETGIFIGRTGRNIRAAQAPEHIFGYAIFNDFSARDPQMREMAGHMGPAKGKSFDTGNAIGPWIVTRDEIADPQSLNVCVRVNGEIRGKSTTAQMLHSFAEMIAFVSRDETVHAGEFFGSGTIGGCCGLEIDRYLADGDMVELEVSGLGTLRNRVVRTRS